MGERDTAITDLEGAIQSLGAALWTRARRDEPGVLDRAYWQDHLLEWSMRDESLRTDMFRFVDALPTLATSAEVARHAREYLLKPGRSLPAFLGTALKASASGVGAAIAAGPIRAGVEGLANRFIIGRDPASAINHFRELRARGLAFTADLLGEATLSDSEARAYLDRYLDLIDRLAAESAGWTNDGVLDHDAGGPIPRASVSVKMSALAPWLDPASPASGVTRLSARVLPLLLRAKKRNVSVTFDLEQWSLHGITYDLFESLATHKSLRDWPHMGIVIQAYLRRAADDVERLLALAKRRGVPLGVRLVKGAYWEYEVASARQRGLEPPVLLEKAATDEQYERLTARLLDNTALLKPAFGTHNLRSIAHAIARAEQSRVHPLAYEVQMLYGMAAAERDAIRSRGVRVRLYCPIGDLLPGMAYLVRRLLENTSNAGFLRLAHHEHADMTSLLQPPHANGHPRHHAPTPSAEAPMPTPFANCAFTDFAHTSQRLAFGAAVEAIRHRLPTNVPIVVNGRTHAGDETIHRVCPDDATRVVAHVSAASIGDADEAVTVAYRACPAWRDRPLSERAALLDKLADALERDRLSLAALQVWEVGKPWAEADADVAEAIDYCRYYARRAMEELAPRRLASPAGEEDVMLYEGRGPVAVIAPWNFPLAILAGMATAALVAGNTVILKPAEQSSATAYALFEHMRRAGFPADAVHFLPGRGEVVGARLVEHPLVAQVAFTGSKAVGLRIIEHAARTAPHQPLVKRVVCEMGGKNAIIVDESADLDEAVTSIIASAFGYAGQKCSACSRLIVVKRVYDALVHRLIEATRCLPIAPAHEPECKLGPVIDETAHKRLLAAMRELGEGVKVLYRGEAPGGDSARGYFVPPAIVRLDDRHHPLMRNELFGPILAVTIADDFNAAIGVAIDSEFALTAAVFSRTPSHLDEARRRLRVGNLYLNRGCTGAMVGRQPFGGFAMSGGGTKAGGPHYLLNFVDPRVVTENTLRHGMGGESAPR